MIELNIPGRGSLQLQYLVCDVNGDCKAKLSDVIYLVNYIFKPGWQPPVGCPAK